MKFPYANPLKIHDHNRSFLNTLLEKTLLYQKIYSVRGNFSFIKNTDSEFEGGFSLLILLINYMDWKKHFQKSKTLFHDQLLMTYNPNVIVVFFEVHQTNSSSNYNKDNNFPMTEHLDNHLLTYHSIKVG